jgi:hypothetical protein
VKHRLVLAHTHGAQRFDRLPAGHYRWRFHGADGLWRSPSEDTMPELTIDASAALVSIDWGDAGALDVTTDSHGDAQRGTLWVSCVGRRGLHSFAFADGRVRLVGLAPGDYELALCRPGEPHRPDLAKYGARATVRAGEATTTELAPR